MRSTKTIKAATNNPATKTDVVELLLGAGGLVVVAVAVGDEITLGAE
jgi:hypothetical protein